MTELFIRCQNGYSSRVWAEMKVQGVQGPVRALEEVGLAGLSTQELLGLSQTNTLKSAKQCRENASITTQQYAAMPCSFWIALVSFQRF